MVGVPGSDRALLKRVDQSGRGAPLGLETDVLLAYI